MIDGGDRAEVYSSGVRVSRKVRKCDECGRIISVGEKYQNAFMVYEKSPATFFTCEHCVVAMGWLLDNCGGYLHGGVWEDFEEHISEYPDLAFGLRRLSIGRRRQWERFDRGGLMQVPAMPPSIKEALSQ